MAVMQVYILDDEAVAGATALFIGITDALIERQKRAEVAQKEEQDG